MDDYTGFRQGLQTMFQRELGFTLMPGLMEGPNVTGTGEWIGSLYLHRIQEDPGRVAEQQVFLVLRAFAPFATASAGLLTPEVPADPEPLERMAAKIVTAIAQNQTGIGDGWFQRVTAMEIDPLTQGVQAQLMAYSSNPATGFTA